MAHAQIIEDDVLIREQGYDDHFHEHHEGDKYRSNFLTTYIFSQDHKIIARQFLITGIFWAIVGAAMSIISLSRSRLPYTYIIARVLRLSIIAWRLFEKKS